MRIVSYGFYFKITIFPCVTLIGCGCTSVCSPHCGQNHSTMLFPGNCRFHGLMSEIVCFHMTKISADCVLQENIFTQSALLKGFFWFKLPQQSLNYRSYAYSPFSGLIKPPPPTNPSHNPLTLQYRVEGTLNSNLQNTLYLHFMKICTV